MRVLEHDNDWIGSSFNTLYKKPSQTEIGAIPGVAVHQSDRRVWWYTTTQTQTERTVTQSSTPLSHQVSSRNRSRNPVLAWSAGWYYELSSRNPVLVQSAGGYYQLSSRNPVLERSVAGRANIDTCGSTSGIACSTSSSSCSGRWSWTSIQHGVSLIVGRG